MTTVKAHALADGEPIFRDGGWEIPLVVEYADGTTGVANVPFLEETDISGVQAYFRSATLEPLEFVI